MKKSINWLVEYFSQNSMEFVNSFKSSLAPHCKELNIKPSEELCTLVIPLRGEGFFFIKDKCFPFNEKTILHYGSSLDVRVEAGDKGFEYYVIHYRNIILTESFKDIHRESFYIDIWDKEPLIKCCENICCKRDCGDNYGKFCCKVEFINLINSLINNVRMLQDNHKLKLVHKAVEYIKTNYDKGMSVSDISDILEVDRRRFSEVFQEVTGQSPIKYIQSYRLQKAKELLENSPYSIKEISDMTGYNDCFYFSKTFKKNVGVSPKKYRENIAYPSTYIGNN